MNKLIICLKLITIFKNVLKNSVVSAFVDTLKSLNEDDFENFLDCYSNFISLLYENDEKQNLYEYIKQLIYTDENIISKNCFDNEKILKTAQYELTLFDNLLKIDFNTIKQSAQKFSEEIVEHLPEYNIDNRIDFNIEDIIKSYKTVGYGNFALYNAFKFGENKEITPVKNFEAMTFDKLKNYEYQKNIIKCNTKCLIDGKETNNILLYGDRGCGKSSTVKALVNEFKNDNLKIIQITKESFVYLPDLYERIKNLPLKFIIFADDISFEEDDKNFSKIKAVLEGSLENTPKNAVIYATTNRMHLVKESFSAREGNEIHFNDTIDETVSLSDRFGIMLTFSVLTKKEYLDITEKIAVENGIKVDDEFLKKAAQFAMQKGIYTPRIAKQFIISCN